MVKRSSARLIASICRIWHLFSWRRNVVVDDARQGGETRQKKRGPSGKWMNFFLLLLPFPIIRPFFPPPSRPLSLAYCIHQHYHHEPQHSTMTSRSLAHRRGASSRDDVFFFFFFFLSPAPMVWLARQYGLFFSSCVYFKQFFFFFSILRLALTACCKDP